MAFFFIAFLLVVSFVFQCLRDKVVLEGDKNKINILFLSIMSLFFYVVLAFRGIDVGNDTVVYFEAYRNISNLNFQELWEYEGRFELGYLLVNKLLSIFFDNPQFLLILTGIFIVLSNVQFLYKYSKMLWLSVLLYFLLRYFDANMNIIRQAMALGFICYSYSFLRERKFWLFTLFVFVAFLFHFSAIVFWFAWFFTKIKFRKEYVLLFMIGLAVTYFLSSYVLSFLFHLNVIYDYYLDSEYLDGGKIAPLLNLLLNMCIITIGWLTKSYKEGNVYVAGKKGNVLCVNDNNNMLMILLMAAFVQVIGLSFALLDRVALYFHFFSVVFLPNSIKCIRSKLMYALVISVVLLVAILYYWIIVTYRPGWNKIYPYHFCF